MGGEDPAQTNDPLVCFLYLLLREHVSPGAIEERVTEIEGGRSWELTNAYLAGYARNLAERLGRSLDISQEYQAKRLREAESHVTALLRSTRVSETDRQTDRRAAEEWLRAGGTIPPPGG
jgi:hypothetical protein